MRPIIMSSHYVQQQQQISKVKQFFSQQLETQLADHLIISRKEAENTKQASQ